MTLSSLSDQTCTEQNRVQGLRTKSKLDSDVGTMQGPSSLKPGLGLARHGPGQMESAVKTKCLDRTMPWRSCLTKGQVMEWTGRMGLRDLQWTETCNGKVIYFDLIVGVDFSAVGARMSLTRQRC